MKVQFHRGDRVFIKSMGTVATVTNVIAAEEIGKPEPIFYLYEVDLSAQARDASDLELVEAGEARRMARKLMAD